MILKVQLSLASSDGKQRVLIYDEHRTVQIQLAASDEIIELMAGRSKAFFSAGVLDTGDSITLHNVAEVPDPGW